VLDVSAYNANMDNGTRIQQIEEEIGRLSAEYRSADGDRQAEIARRVTELEAESARLGGSQLDENQAARAALDRAIGGGSDRQQASADFP
jgi:hypothetical protein